MQKTQHNSSIPPTDIPQANVDSIEATGSAFHRTAQRISQRTTDLIAIAIIGIGVLTVSGRLTEWWNTDSSSAPSPAVSASQLAGPLLQWGKSESAVSLLAGEHPVRMERRVLLGEQDRVDRILRDRLVEILESSAPENAKQPLTNDSHAAAFALVFRRRERQLIGMLKGLPPFEVRQGNWNLYCLDRPDNPIPGTFLIATRIAGDKEQVESLAAWAVGMPSGQKQWTSFVMTPTWHGRNVSTHTVSVPDGAKLLLSLTADSTDELTVFQQLDARHSDVDRWARDLTRQLTGTGWHEARPWQQSTDAATARFERANDGNRHPRQAIELTISFAENRKLTGTANVIAIPEMELVPQAGVQKSQSRDR